MFLEKRKGPPRKIRKIKIIKRKELKQNNYYHQNNETKVNKSTSKLRIPLTFRKKLINKQN